MSMSIRLDRVRLKALVSAIVASAGVREADAELAAECFIASDADGVPSHGLARLRAYVDALRSGFINPSPSIAIAKTGAIAIVDGDRGLGPVVAAAAADAAVELAEEFGSGISLVRHSNHLGMASVFAESISDRGMIGIVMSNASSTMAVWGGCEPVLGTNPLAASMPHGSQPRFILDMASSVVARGKVRLAADRGTEVGEGWAIRSDGKSARTPSEAMEGALLPFGGAKGSGIAMLIELLCGVATAGSVAPDIRTMYDQPGGSAGVGHFILAIDVKRVQETSDFAARYDGLIGLVRRGRPAAGFAGVSIPGERRVQHRMTSQALGIPVGAETLGDVITLAKLAGVDGSLVELLEKEADECTEQMSATL